MARRSVQVDGGMAKLVEKQMRNWELARSQRKAVPDTKRPEVEDFICVSRQVGAAGHQVADLLGSRLNWPLFDKEILDTMAGDDAIRRQIYESMDERDLSWYEEAVRSLLQGEFVRNDYFRRLTETILSIARQGSAVFLGRGAGAILPQDRGFRLRLVAPLNQRIGRVSQLWHLNADQAKERIDRIEAERAEYLRRHFRLEVDDALRQDLVINVGRCTPVQAAEIVLHARQIKQRSVS